MNNADLEFELVRKFASLQNSLGEILWRLPIAHIDYRPFMAAQKIASAQLKKKAQRTILFLKITLWIVTFILSIYIFKNYNLAFDAGVVTALSAIVVTFCLFLFGHARAIYKALYEVRRDLPCYFLFGEGGVLLVSDFDIQFFPWDSMTNCLKDKHGQYLVMKHAAVLILPEAALVQHPDANALIAFIDERASRSSAT